MLKVASIAVLAVIQLVLSHVALCQSVQLAPDPAVAEGEYRDAEDAWLRNDPNLEADLFKANREEIRVRIRHASELRDQVMQKKSVYLEFMLKRLDLMSARLEDGKGGTLPVEDLKKKLEDEQIELLVEQERLETRIRDLPPGDEYVLVRRAMDEERTALVNLQNNVAVRIHAFGNLAVAQKTQADLESRDPLDDRLADVKKIWEQEKERAVRSRTEWAKYYREMERALDAKAPADDQHKKKKTKAESVPDEIPAAHPAANLPPFQGTWAYRSEPGGWTGFGEPKSAQLELRQESIHVSGVYTAVLPGRGDMRSVRLELDGKCGPDFEAAIRWTSLYPPARGEMTLSLGGDRRILVERLYSTDSYVPVGMEVLEPR